MIDFSKITKTLDGYDCHYFGTRESYGTKLHCFGVMTVNGVMEKCYDDSGRHLFFNTTLREWDTSKSNAFQIIKSPKIVEVTQYIALYEKNFTPGEYYIVGAKHEDEFSNTQLIRGLQQHTFRFEVPHD